VLGYTVAGEGRPLRELARTFDGAYPYLEMIAAANRIADPLDRRVVEAYWLGNSLTARVKARALHEGMQERFRSRLGPRDWRWLENSAAAGAAPVHAHHVFDVFPRVGLLRAGAVDDVLQVMDSCRIRWGRVRAVENGTLVVDTSTLVQRDGRIALGDPRPEVVERWRDGAGFVDQARPDDLVSVHWGWACDRLDDRQLANLEAWTQRALRIANQAL
jgi:hypothetical protein